MLHAANYAAGIYMLQIPRKVPAVMLASGSRVEVLARCKAPAGSSYVLSATNNPDPFNPNNVASFANDVNRVVQQSVATITISVSTSAMQASRHCKLIRTGTCTASTWIAVRYMIQCQLLLNSDKQLV